jgi:hypothetical protein
MPKPKTVSEEIPQEVRPIKKAKVDTFFNVKDIHIERINALLNAGNDKVIIHGDGCLFTGKLGQKFGEAGKTMEEGSDHHKEFNSGAPSINKQELVSRASYRATYTKANRPVSVEAIIEDFYANESNEMQENLKPQNRDTLSNTVSVK